jgi:uncharacterized protein Yka (UPF0111/DUF47 family)
MKSQILDAIGETALQPAVHIHAALAANDRLKFFFSLLQMALTFAEHPDQPAVTLKRERLACGIDEPELDSVIAKSRMTAKSCYVPGVARILAHIAEDLRIMAAPILTAGPETLRTRLDGLLKALPATPGDTVDPNAIAAMMRADHSGPDSVHRMVMDLHKRLNAMQAELAEETLDGAAVYNLSQADRPLVSAFMSGLNRTAKLKLNHPGLATTATREGDRLVIQNDIGTTDAHVIVIGVQGLTVTVTYTDVHEERLAFFEDMLSAHGVIWDQERQAALTAGSAFHVAAGSFEGKDAGGTCAYLEALGSRLVFLIDWNRARKQLRGFLRGPDRLALLAWAAKADIGHRAFLELGGAQLVNQAIEATSGSSMHFGDRLCDVLGDAEALKFMRSVFQAAAEGLLSGQSQTLIRDRIRITLAAHFSNEEQQLLRLAADHAGLIFELASSVRDGLGGEAAASTNHARRARRFEHDADHLVIETREAIRLRPEYSTFLSLMQEADEAADELEDAAFLIGLEKLEGKSLEKLQVLANILGEASQEWVKALGHAAQAGVAANSLERDDFVASIDRLGVLEHRADEAERAVTESAIKHAQDFRQLHLLTAIAASLESAADALKRVSLILREHIFEDVISG